MKNGNQLLSFQIQTVESDSFRGSPPNLRSPFKHRKFFPFLIETEYWGQIPQPNLMVESTTHEVADLLAAYHTIRVNWKEIRFTYDYLWMQDNVRRGAEVVGGQGGKAPDFNFATLYRISRWNGKEINPVWNKGKILPAGKNSRDFLNSH